MKFEILIFGMTAFFIANVYHDGKYVQIMKSWKKYYQMVGIGFAGLSAYLFIRKYPAHSRSLFNHANGIIKYMPIDKDASDMLTPIFNMGRSDMFSNNYNENNGNNGNINRNNYQGNNYQGNNYQGNNYEEMSHQQKRMMNSGKGNNTKRCVSETKKKFVAAQQGWKCGDCKQQLPAWFETDHKIRLDNGGSNHVDNLVALCRDCHGKKTAFENL